MLYSLRLREKYAARSAHETLGCHASPTATLRRSEVARQVDCCEALGAFHVAEAVYSPRVGVRHSHTQAEARKGSMCMRGWARSVLGAGAEASTCYCGRVAHTRARARVRESSVGASTHARAVRQNLIAGSGEILETNSITKSHLNQFKVQCVLSRNTRSPQSTR